MNLNHLRTFVKIAELGSLSKASDRLRITQPALSRQMKLLQEDVGVPLFERHRAGMQVTVAGLELLRRATAIIRQTEEMYTAVRSLADTTRGQVAFGIVPTVSCALAVDLATRIARELPDVSLRVVEGYAGHLVEWLQRGEIDAAIVYGPQNSLHMRAEELLTEHLEVVGPPDCNLNPRKAVSFAEFVRLPLVLPGRPHGLRMVIESVIHQTRAKLKVRHEADSFRVLIELVQRGLGYTVLPLSAIRREVAEQRLRHAPLVNPPVARELVLCMPDRPVSPATRTVISIVRDELVRNLVSGDGRARVHAPARPATR